MHLSKIVSNIERTMRTHSSQILTGGAVVGLGTTVYLTARSSFAAARRLNSEDLSPHDVETSKKKAQLVWDLYIPPAVSGVFTVGCILGAQRSSSKKLAAAQAAFVLTEQAYAEYRSHVTEEIGEKAERKIRDKVAQSRVDGADVPTSLSPEAMLPGSGQVLCREDYTGRYFLSDMESLRRAENEVNHGCMVNDWVYLGDFQDLVGLEHVDGSYEFGWQPERLMELDFSSAVTKDGRPCLTFSYNYLKPA